jgi:hypothetical protein
MRCASGCPSTRHHIRYGCTLRARGDGGRAGPESAGKKPNIISVLSATADVVRQDLVVQVVRQAEVRMQ